MEITVDIGFIASFIAINAMVIGIVFYFATLRAQIQWVYDALHSPDENGFGSGNLMLAQGMIMRDIRRLMFLTVWSNKADKADKPPQWARDMLREEVDPGLSAEAELTELLEAAKKGV